MATGNFAATEGSGKNAATYTFAEDAITKFLQRVGLCDATGADIAGSPSATAWTSGNGTLISLLKAIATTAISTGDSPVESHQPCDVITFTPTIDTVIYAAGDVLFTTVLLSGIARANDLRAILSSLTIVDKAKQNAAITLLFYQTNVTSAALNAANAMSDADQLSLMGTVDIAAADWKTWANNSTLCYAGPKSPGLLLEAVSGGTGVYVVGIVGTGSTPTYATPSDLVLKLGVIQQ